MARGRRVRVFAQRVRVPFREDFHQPPIKIIDGVIHDWFEAAVVLSMCFFNVIFQSDAEISVLAAEAHLLRSEHFYILHRNFGYPIRSEEHTSELQSRLHLVCRLLLEKKKNNR